MSITSTVFLFIFLPLAIGIYFILPKKNIIWRNIYLLILSLAFYAYGEALRLLLLVALIIATYFFGIMASGKRNTKCGKWAVALTVIINIGALFFYKYFSIIWQKVLPSFGITELPAINFVLPLGLSFFCFSSISYVVDVYREKTPVQKNFLNLALYLSIFYKVTQGPITQYNQFEKYLYERKVTFDLFANGVWRFIFGLGKKILLAGTLGIVASRAFDADYNTLPVLVAWLGSFAYMLQLYFDFSGYSDMAIGLGKMFGFETPENFDYPYFATSVTEYWQKWHKTLGEWFRDYLYYPITLGPAIKLRKSLAKKHSRAYGKFMVNVLTLGIIWLATSVWHGSSINYLIWGLINGGVSLAEVYQKPHKDNKSFKFLGWCYTFFIALMVKTLTNVATVGEALHYYGAMFGFNGNALYSGEFLRLLLDYAPFLIVGTIASFPVFRWIKTKVENSNKKWLQISYAVVSSVFAIVVLVLSISYIERLGFSAFMYQKF